MNFDKLLMEIVLTLNEDKNSKPTHKNIISKFEQKAIDESSTNEIIVKNVINMVV